MTPAERLHDEAVLHRIALSRYSNTTVRRVLAQLNRTEESVLERLARADNEGLQAARLENLLVEIRALQANGWAVVRANLNGDLTALAMAEAEFAAKAVRFGAESAGLQLTTNAPVTAQVVAAVNSRPFQGRLLREWLADAEEGAAKRVREVIRQGFIEGRSISDLVRQIRGTRAAQYRDGILEVSRRGAEAMVRTAVTHTSAAAHQEVYRSFGADVVTGVLWIATLDSRTTEICASRDGKVFPVDSGPRPPAHVNCLPGGAVVATGSRITGAFQRWYDGDVVVIRTATGKQLTCTPNHPILTDGGWVAAGLLNVGGNVVCDAGIERKPLVDGDNEYVEARIEDVAKALFGDEQMATVPVPTTAEDFHGDGIDGEVAIVATDRSLDHGREAPGPQHVGENDLALGDVGLAKLAGGGGLAPLLLARRTATNSVVGGSRKSRPLIRVGAVHAALLLLASISKGMAALLQDARNRRGAAAEDLGDTDNADAIKVKALDLGVIDRNRPPSGEREDEAVSAHEAVDHFSADTDLAADLLAGRAGPVSLDEIISVDVRKFLGHVFNLETATGWYVAENIITHNCRSTTAPQIRGLPPIERQSYAAWFAKQPAAVQDDILGKSKGQLYRNGGLPLDRFTDNKGRTLTLQELRSRDLAAFKRAGLD